MQALLAIPELKTLYVGITRARLGCAILECQEADVGGWAPLLQGWEEAGLVEVWRGQANFAAAATALYPQVF